MKNVLKALVVLLAMATLCFGLVACGGGESESEASSYTSPYGFTHAYGTDDCHGSAYAFFALNDSEDYGAYIAVGKAKNFSTCYMGEVTKSEEDGKTVYSIDASDLAIKVEMSIDEMTDEKCVGSLGFEGTDRHPIEMESIDVEDFDEMVTAIQEGTYEFDNPLE
ncbi:MAG: hypothetical protein PUE62_06075 [Coriobacteriaceae bacterium]|nr:hypothetical protein [Coriobacteriaceae bacterium]